MKIKLLMAGLLGLVSATAFAQKGELNTAKDNYEKFQLLKGPSNATKLPPLAATSLATAKTSIDKAAVNDKTATLPLTYALKGAIYAALALNDTIPATSTPLFNDADAALKKAKEVDTKNENKTTIDGAYLYLAQYEINKGKKEFDTQKYDQAYHSFDYYRSVMPEDTTAIYYTGLAAANAKNYPAAITHYNKLLSTNYSGKAGIYMDLSSIYIANKDTAAALKTVTEGVAKYPGDNDLRKREIEISLATGKEKEVISKIESAIAANPKNKTLYYYSGLTYSSAAENAAAQAKAAKTPVAKAKFEQDKTTNFAKAADMYKKALEIDPNYFEANLNLGYVIVSPAIDGYNAANKLPASKQKEYEAGIAKANTQFALAKPYLVKAVELNPKSREALTNLRSYYLGTKDAANASKIKAQLDALDSAQ